MSNWQAAILGQIIGASLLIFLLAWALEKLVWRHMLDTPKAGLLASVLSATAVAFILYLLLTGVQWSGLGPFAYFVAAPIVLAFRYWRESRHWGRGDDDLDALDETFS